MLLQDIAAAVFGTATLLAGVANAQQGAACDENVGCLIGCCSKFGTCGFDDQHCGKGNCINNCDAKAECGKYADPSNKECPLGVCCSKYGFCGTTSEFCGTGCQSGCMPIITHDCTKNSETAKVSYMDRRIAYYESWAVTKRTCDVYPPELIPASALTHVNYAFALIGSDGKITDTEGDLYRRVTRLKTHYLDLRVSIAVGGWAFSDPGPTRTRWSNMARTTGSRSTFIDSVVSFLQKYGFDGIDLDWEYPAADDRGGKDVDFDNFPKLLKEMRAAFDDVDPSWEITVTLPCSYWYLKHFDLKNLEPHVDWFNLMSYDIHGLWDKGNKWTGAYLKGHTNLTEIDNGLDLLWRNGVGPDKVVMGLGFYGRSFTVTDTSCTKPGCTFKDPGQKGECTGEAGILSYAEIQAKKHRLNSVEEHYTGDEEGVTYMVYDVNQWISYDDEKSFAAKKKFMEKRCLGGMMIWAIDQDTQDHQALIALLGEDYVKDAMMKGGKLTDSEKEGLSTDFAPYDGRDCYVTPHCNDNRKTDDKWATCLPGFIPIEDAHEPVQKGSTLFNQGTLQSQMVSCKSGWWHKICCKKETAPKNCKWEGGPVDGDGICRGGLGEITCGSDKFELNTDYYTAREGNQKCPIYSGVKRRRSLCCDASPVLKKCKWQKCSDGTELDCPSGQTAFTFRGDDESGASCAKGAKQVLCCPTKNTYKNCEWKPPSDRNNPLATSDDACVVNYCSDKQVSIAQARLPNKYGGERSPCGYFWDLWDQEGVNQGQASRDIIHQYCCDPPSAFGNDWPVDPKYLWPDPSYEDDSWTYTPNIGNNDKDKDSSGAEDGSDPYGFIMMDGDEDAIQSDFKSDFVFVHADPKTKMRRRSLEVNDTNIIENTFAHVEEEWVVHCAYPPGDPRCDNIFKGVHGAEQTIITLPGNVGEGPYARIVSMEPVEDEYQLPSHHKHKRAEDSQKFKLKFDFNFKAIQRDDDKEVRMRIDYTNLVGYWDEMTNSEGDKKRRDVSKRNLQPRWWGTFKRWLQKMSMVENKDHGELPMNYNHHLVLYSSRIGCPRGTSTLQAGMDITTDFDLAMNMRYAYYLRGTIVPPKVEETYAYFGLAPEAALTLTIKGSATLQYKSERKKLIDTLSYPGLSIKGIVTVGPSLDVWGQIKGMVTLAGKIEAGVKVLFPPAEMYYPQDSEAKLYEKMPDVSKIDMSRKGGVEPSFDASVDAQADLDILVTPEVNMGVRILGGTIADVQLVGYVNNTLNFHIEGHGHAGTGGVGGSFKWSVNYFYNFGYGAYAKFIKLWDWKISPRLLWNDNAGKGKMITLFSGPNGKRKRAELGAGPEVEEDWEELYGNTTLIRDELSSMFDNPSMGSSSSGRSLQKRLSSDDIANFAKGLLKCTDAGTCLSAGAGGHDPDEGEKVKRALERPPVSKIRRRDDDSDTTDSRDACSKDIPALMYNCRYFPDDVVSGPVSDMPLTGICNNIKNYLTAHGMGRGPMQLTYEGPSDAATDARRLAACVIPGGRDHCSRSDVAWYRDNVDITFPDGAAGTNWRERSWSSCDEFPFASVAEGGVGAGWTCAPVYQQDYQGASNSLLGNMETKISWTDDNDVEHNEWKSWRLPWHKSPATDAGAWNEEYVYRKEFTLHLYSSEQNSNWDAPLFSMNLQQNPGANQLRQGGINLITDAQWIIAAVNLLNNPAYRIRNEPSSGIYHPWANAICVDPQHPTRGYGYTWRARPNYIPCQVVFDYSQAATKKRDVNDPDFWRIKNITFIRDNPLTEDEAAKAIYDMRKLAEEALAAEVEHGDVEVAAQLDEQKPAHHHESHGHRRHVREFRNP